MAQSHVRRSWFCVGACATIFACGARTETSDGTWLPEGWAAPSTSSSAPGIQQPTPLPPNPTPTSTPWSVEPGRTDPPSPEPWATPPPSVDLPPAICSSKHEVVYPRPFTFGIHAAAIEFTEETAGSQWCIRFAQGQLPQTHDLSNTGFGLMFGLTREEGGDVPFDLAARHVTTMRVRGQSRYHHAVVAMTEADWVRGPDQELFSWTSPIYPFVTHGESYIPIEQVTNRSGRPIRPHRFIALRFHIIGEVFFDDTICIDNVAFLDACGNVTVEAAVEKVSEPAPTVTHNSPSTAPPDDSTTDVSTADVSWDETTTATQPLTDVPTWSLDAGVSDDQSTTNSL